MFEKKLYAFWVLLSLSCNAYAMERRGEGDEVASSTLSSIPGPSSSNTPDQETNEVGVSNDRSSTTLTFKWSHLVNAKAKDSEKGRRARTLFAYFLYLREVFYDRKRDREVWQRRNPDSFYTLPISIKDLDAPNGSSLNPLWVKYGKETDKAIKIATIIGVLPTTKEVITGVAGVLESPEELPLEWHSSHKQRELQLKRLSLEAARRLKEERTKRQRLQASLEDEIKEKEAIKKEKEELSAELENLKDECQRLRSDFEGVADFFEFPFQR
ncbi:hypothetical protein QM565_11420 [Geitlerinema splendidum]|jgi:hypothetical protein|nr:hypothetical protein [Geitlerinema splendidum]